MEQTYIYTKKWDSKIRTLAYISAHSTYQLVVYVPIHPYTRRGDVHAAFVHLTFSLPPLPHVQYFVPVAAAYRLHIRRVWMLPRAI